MGDLPSMFVLKALFPDAETARSAETDLQDRQDLGDAEIAAAPAGGDPGLGAVTPSKFGAVLAWRFREHLWREIFGIIDAHGGVIVDYRREGDTR